MDKVIENLEVLISSSTICKLRFYFTKNPHLLCIPDVPVQISATRPAILTGFSWLSSVRPGECRDSILKFGHDLKILSNSSFTYRVFIRRFFV
jgi:hypothetical protein